MNGHDTRTKESRILLAEGSSIIADEMRCLLTDSGYQVCTVTKTPGDTLKALDQFKPDLIIFDSGITVSSGQLLSVLDRADALDIPVLHLIDWHVDEKKLLRCRVPRERIVRKPYHVDALLFMIRELLKHRERAAQMHMYLPVESGFPFPSPVFSVVK